MHNWRTAPRCELKFLMLLESFWSLSMLTVEDLRWKVLNKNAFLLSWLPVYYIYIYICIYIYNNIIYIYIYTYIYIHLKELSTLSVLWMNILKTYNIVNVKKSLRKIAVIMITMCPSVYYNNGFVATHALENMYSTTVHYVPKCMSSYKASVVVINNQQGTLLYCFHDCIYL